MKGFPLLQVSEFPLFKLTASKVCLALAVNFALLPPLSLTETDFTTNCSIY